MDEKKPTHKHAHSRAHTLSLLSLFAIGAGVGVGFGGSGRPDFEPAEQLPSRAPAPPLKRHQTPFTPKQKLTRAKRKAQRKARKGNR